MSEYLSEEMLLSIPTPDELGVTFRIEANGDLWVNYKPSGFPVQLEAEHLAYIMDLAGVNAADYPPEPANVGLLQDAIRRTEPLDMRLGGPVDSFLEVHLSPNQMLAGVVLHPPKGKGKYLTRAEIYEQLRSAQVVEGLVDEALNELTHPETQAAMKENGQPRCMLVAFGDPHKDGDDAWLESLLDTIADRRPQKDALGNIDFLELGDFPHVNADELLVRRHPPTKGKDGWTVTGKSLKGKDGKDLSLRATDPSVKLADSDQNVLLSTVAGMPVIDEKGAHVEKVLRLDEIGLKTGHIRFDGSLLVKGNINSGMKVEVTGDVKVGGLVEAAWVTAGGSIEISGGVIGRNNKDKPGEADTKPLEEEAKVDNAYIKAGTLVKARFIQEAKVVAGEEIVVGRQALHSNLTAGIKIHLPGRAAVVGGVAKAKQLIDVGVSGAPANIATKLIVGDSSKYRARLAQVNQILKQIEKQKSQLQELISKIKQQRKPITEEKKQQILQARKLLAQKEEKAYQQLEEIDQQIKDLQTARVQVRTTCFPGSIICIDDDELAPRNDLGKVTFYMRDGSINMR